MSGDDSTARFERIVQPHLGDAYALARWITGDRADADDVVQEACLRAFRAIGGYAGGNARAAAECPEARAADLAVHYLDIKRDRGLGRSIVDAPRSIGV